MDRFSIIFDKDIEKDLKKIPKKIVQNILRKTSGLAANPTPAQSLKLSGTEGTYRLRVGDYRIIYTVNDSVKEITVYHIRHRKDIYRKL
ncbi:MAG: type II toxin-antitoxin system RelE/ParE family toxin [Deltaproteobacteria bacterium]|nr:type II toxin-antitoxin system RelE/ParE family toxin [Deltaproteobacteria bacterium]